MTNIPHWQVEMRVSTVHLLPCWLHDQAQLILQASVLQAGVDGWVGLPTSLGLGIIIKH